MFKSPQWRWALVSVAVVAFGMAALDPSLPIIRPIIAISFVFFVPGIALMRLLHVYAPLRSVILAVASSMALTLVVTLLVLYLEVWDVQLATGLLAGVTITLVAAEIWMARRPAPPPEPEQHLVEESAVALLSLNSEQNGAGDAQTDVGQEDHPKRDDRDEQQPTDTRPPGDIEHLGEEHDADQQEQDAAQRDNEDVRLNQHE